MSSYQALHDGWTLAVEPGLPDVPAHVSGRAFDASVPGCVHTDLLAAGVIPDPYLDDNEERLTWIGRADWRYETVFAWQDEGAERVDLVCAGLDTVAEVLLNGEVVAKTANMHRGYRFDVRELLTPGANRLAIRFESAIRYAERLRDELGERPRAYPEPYNFIRKMACNFGWDWGPALVSAGIWQPIGLHSWRAARLATVRPLITVADGTARVNIHIDVERAGSADPPLLLTARVAGTKATTVVPVGGSGAMLELTVDRPELWWPRGYGAQPLYQLEVALADPEGHLLDTWHRRIGFRSVRLDTTPDEHGSAFTIVVNDAPVFARGGNWIPDDCFPNRVDRDRYAVRLGQACDANINLLRVWGGGRYESEEFYELCDELGLLVWQDFLFACAAYPEEPPLADEIEAEATSAVVRLCSHPSLVMWCGNNENVMGYHDWGWREQLDGRTWGEGYYLRLLPRIVESLDPTRPYWPGSPYSGEIQLAPNADDHGPSHVWDVWNERDYTAYRERVPRFVAEFGFQGPPTFATLRRALRDEPLTPDSPGMRHHQKAVDGEAKLARGLRAHFADPRSFDDWLYLNHVNQARAVSLGIEHFRSHAPRCSGTVVWQVNDCWPVTSWAAVDGDGRPKPLWYALRRSYRDRLLTVQPRGKGLALVAVNDTGQQWIQELPVNRHDLNGKPLATTVVRVAVAPRATQTIILPEAVARAGEPCRELLVAGVGENRAWWFFAVDKEIAYPPAAYDAMVRDIPDGHIVTVTAHTLLRDLALFADRLDPDARVDDMLVTLLPGESLTFHVRASVPLDPRAMTAAPVLRCVNDGGLRSPDEVAADRYARSCEMN